MLMNGKCCRKEKENRIKKIIRSSPSSNFYHAIEPSRSHLSAFNVSLLPTCLHGNSAACQWFLFPAAH